MQDLQPLRCRSCVATSDKDEELLLFHDMHKEYKEREDSQGTRSDLPLTPNSTSEKGFQAIPSKFSDDLLSYDRGKHDYDWLLTPPTTPPVSTKDLNGIVERSWTAKASQVGLSRSEPPSRPDPSSRAVRGNLGLHQKRSSASKAARTAAAKRSPLRTPCSSTAVVNPTAKTPSTTSDPSFRRSHTPMPQGNATSAFVRSSSVSSGSSKIPATSSPSLFHIQRSRGGEINREQLLNSRLSIPDRAVLSWRTRPAAPRSGLPGEMSCESTDTGVFTRHSRGVQNGSRADSSKCLEKEQKLSDDVISSSQLKQQQSTKPTPLKDINAKVSSIRESAGYGSNGLKKPLNSVLKHLNIQKNSLKVDTFSSLISSLWDSSACNAKLGSQSTDSSMATSSISSSEQNVGVVVDLESSEHGDSQKCKNGTENDPILSLFDEERVTNWLSSPDFLSDI